MPSRFLSSVRPAARAVCVTLCALARAAEVIQTTQHKQVWWLAVYVLAIVAALAENDSTLGHDSIVVVAQKIQFLRDQAGLLAASEEAPLVSMIDGIEDAVAVEDFAAANALVDAMRSRVSARAGTHIPDEWRATRDVANIAGELLSGLDTLAFSIGYLRDYGP